MFLASRMTGIEAYLGILILIFFTILLIILIPISYLAIRVPMVFCFWKIIQETISVSYFFKQDINFSQTYISSLKISYILTLILAAVFISNYMNTGSYSVFLIICMQILIEFISVNITLLK